MNPHLVGFPRVSPGANFMPPLWGVAVGGLNATVRRMGDVGGGGRDGGEELDGLRS